MKNSILQKAVIALHIGVCIFLLLGFIEEFENGKKILLNFDFTSTFFYKTLSYCIAFSLIIFYTISAISTGTTNKELSILFSFFALFGVALHCYTESQEIMSSTRTLIVKYPMLDWIFMSSFPILLLMIAFLPLLNSYNSSTFYTNSYLDSELTKDSFSKQSYFWRIHRIFSILLFILAFEFCVHIIISKNIEWTIYAVTSFLLISSVLLWFLPKSGSIFLSIFCLFIIIGIYYLFISNPPKKIIITFIPILITLLFGSIPFILFNKDSRQEWKMK